jgi:hypothetical protein
MQKAEMLKIFRPNFNEDEIKFLSQLCREEKCRLKQERREVVDELRDVRKKLAIIEAEGRTTSGVTYVLNYARVPEKVVLEHGYETYRKREQELTVERYLINQRWCILEGFIKRFNLLLDGRRTRGGRLSFLSCEARRMLFDAFAADDLMFKRPTLEDDSP